MIWPEAVVTSNLETDGYYLESYLQPLSHSMYEGTLILAGN